MRSLARLWAAARNGYPAAQDIRWTNGAPCSAGARLLSDLAGVEDDWNLTPLWNGDHLIYVFSGSVGRFRSARHGRPDSYARDVSAVCTIKEAKW